MPDNEGNNTLPMKQYIRYPRDTILYIAGCGSVLFTIQSTVAIIVQDFLSYFILSSKVESMQSKNPVCIQYY